MEPSERIQIIQEIANELGKQEWSMIDLALRQFKLPWTDQWSGAKADYVVVMIQEGPDEVLLDLARHLKLSQFAEPIQPTLSQQEIKPLMRDIESQKALMIAVSTGGPRIQQVNEEYKERRISILAILQTSGIQDPNPHLDLWNWYGKWSDGSLPSYQSRRNYVTSLYQPLLDNLMVLSQQQRPVKLTEPTGWVRVDRTIDKITRALSLAKNEEDCQSVGLLCREATISLALAVYDPISHPPQGDTKPSETDAKRMLEDYIAATLPGSSNEELRKYAKDAYQLAVVLQHKRNANFRDAAMCSEAIRSLVNIISIIAGQRDP